MNAADKATLTDRIESFWKIDDRKLAAYIDWFERKHVTVDQALAAIDALSDTSKFLPKPAELHATLSELGVFGSPKVGIGDRGVIEGMKARILAGVKEHLDLLGGDHRDRLQDEFAATRDHQADDLAYDLGGADYWRDRITAFQELLHGDEMERAS